MPRLTHITFAMATLFATAAAVSAQSAYPAGQSSNEAYQYQNQNGQKATPYDYDGGTQGAASQSQQYAQNNPNDQYGQQQQYAPQGQYAQPAPAYNDQYGQPAPPADSAIQYPAPAVVAAPYPYPVYGYPYGYYGYPYYGGVHIGIGLGGYYGRGYYGGYRGGYIGGYRGGYIGGFHGSVGGGFRAGGSFHGGGRR